MNPHAEALDPKSSVSANFTTLASFEPVFLLIGNIVRRCLELYIMPEKMSIEIILFYAIFFREFKALKSVRISNLNGNA